MDRLEIVLKQIEFARTYTQTLLEDIEDNEWFSMPTADVSHIAWQVGHIAMAQYGLALFRLRGRLPEDKELMSGQFRKKFFKGTTPSSNPDDYPSVPEILNVFHRVHEQVLCEVPGYTDEQLDAAADPPFAGYPSNYGGLLLAAHHEMLHAGQIGFLRRLMGKTPVR